MDDLRINQELTAEEQKEVFIRCLENTVDGSAGITLNEVFFREDNAVTEKEISKRMSPDIKPLMRFANGYIFLDLTFPSSECVEIKSANHIWEQYLDLSTEAVKTGNGRDFFFTVSVVGTDEKNTYVMEFSNPAFLYTEGDRISMSVPLDRLYCYIFETDFSKMEAEEEYLYRTETGNWT